MSPDEARHKLATITTLTAGELLGWWRYVHRYRPPFDGEVAALTTRAAVLRINLPPDGGPMEGVK